MGLWNSVWGKVKGMAIIKRYKSLLQRGKGIIDEIKKIELPLDIRDLVKEYKKVGGKDDFFWKWSLWAIRKTPIFPSINKNYFDSLERARFLLNMYVILVDEISERKDGNEENLLNRLLIIPFEKPSQFYNLLKFTHLNNKDHNFFKFATKTWREFEKEVKKYPRYRELKDIFKFNINQALNGLHYDYIINKNPNLINFLGNLLYSSYSTQVITAFIINAMCLKRPIKEFNLVMKISWEAQKMVRIGNWIATWRREISENDFTGGVFSYAVDHKIIKTRDIYTGNKIGISKKIIKFNIENCLLDNWGTSYNRLKELSKQVKFMNIERLLQVLEDFLAVDLIIRDISQK